jgi:hypothetical protein
MITFFEHFIRRAISAGLIPSAESVFSSSIVA